jgi:hypothetical protein
MGLFSSNSDNSIIELYRQKVHLSNDYLQALTPVIESITENEGRRHGISNQLLQLVDELKDSLNPDIFIKAVAFTESFVKYSETSTDNYNKLISYWTEMGESTKELVAQYGNGANGR